MLNIPQEDIDKINSLPLSEKLKLFQFVQPERIQEAIALEEKIKTLEKVAYTWQLAANELAQELEKYKCKRLK